MGERGRGETGAITTVDKYRVGILEEARMSMFESSSVTYQLGSMASHLSSCCLSLHKKNRIAVVLIYQCCYEE